MSNTPFIVGDAGGTNTHWRLVKGDEIKQFVTIGFNAYTHKVEDLQQDIIKVFGTEIEKDISTFFYAAGVDTAEQKVEVSEALCEIFGNKLQVENDLLGVARSVCGKEEGYVGIMGTGSNACFYNGETVNKVSASLGFILGDEGSGAYLGKKLLKLIFRDQLSEEIIDSFQEKFNLTSHQVIQQIYDKPLPNQYLASFAPFIYEHRNHPEVFQLVYDAFQRFFSAYFIKKDSDRHYHFSGSIAFHFADILRQVGSDNGISIKNILESPISGLVLYHQQYD